MRIFFIIGIGLSLFCSFFLFPGITQAQEEACGESSISVVARDPNGTYLSGASVDIFEQTLDADANPKPGLKIISGKTSALTGFFTAIVKKAEGKTYAVKINMAGKEETAFWSYNNILACATDIEVSKTLSALNFVIRDSSGALKKNESFSVYLQNVDADGNPIREKSGLLATPNTGESGNAKIYLPSAGDGIDNSNRYYIFEKISDGAAYLKYDISSISGGESEVTYRLSDLKLLFKNFEGKSFPGNEKIEIFNQTTDSENRNILGLKIKDIFSDDSGTALFFYQSGVYVAKISGSGGKFAYFWDLFINDQERSEYELTTDEDWLPVAGACDSSLAFTLISRDLNYQFIPGINFKLFEQVSDTNGLPAVGNFLAGGVADEKGEGRIMINPDPRRQYALQIFDRNAKAGDFWYFNELRFVCGENEQITKQLPKTKIRLRDGSGDLKKNYVFSLYTQKADADANPIKEKKDLIAADFNTGEKGELVVYLSPKHQHDKEKNGVYVLLARGADKAEFVEYDLRVEENRDLDFDYVFSELALSLKDPNRVPKKQKTLELYRQARNASGNYTLGEKIKTVKTDDYGETLFEYPFGYYAAVILDDLGRRNIFWNTRVKNRTRSTFDLIENNTVVKTKSASGQFLSGKSVNIYDLKESTGGVYIKDKKIKTLTVKDVNEYSLSLSPGPYLFTVIDSKIEYGQALYSENGKNQNVTISLIAEQVVGSDKKFSLKKPEETVYLGDRLKGKILLQVESRGEAWYVDVVSRKRFYIKDGDSAYTSLRKFGLGITNLDLEKIPIGIDDRFEEWDYDGDGVPDKLEEAIGTDMYNPDTDGDGYDDGTEIRNGYNPLGPGKMVFDMALTEKLKGRILLQVESRGEAWYLNPADGKRYYMKDGESAYEIMRFLSLGISDSDLDKIESASLGAD